MSEEASKEDVLDVDAVNDRLALIHSRLHQRRLGLASVPQLDFDAYIEEDLEWLLDFIESGTIKAHAKASEAMEMFDEVKEGILKLPESFNSTETKLAAVAKQLRESAEFLHESRELMSRMRNELGLLDEAADVQLRAVQQELITVRSQLRDECSRHHRTRQDWDEDKKQHSQQIGALRADKDRLASQVRDLSLKSEELQKRIDNLPSTWHERVLADDGVLPDWVQVGTKVKMNGLELYGYIDDITLSHVRVTTPSGTLEVAPKVFPGSWKRTS